MAVRDYICPNCGVIGQPKKITKGSFGMEVVLWLCFIVPGVLYSLWRLSSRHEGCRSCGQAGVIRTDTPRGQQLVRQFSAQ